MPQRDPVRYEGSYCTHSISSPAPGVVVLRIDGTDVGELADVPMRQLETYLTDQRRVELFIDARSTIGAATGHYG